MCYKTKNIIQHINVVTKPRRNLFYFKKYFVRIAKHKLYVYIVSVNIRKFMSNNSPCGSIYFKLRDKNFLSSNCISNIPTLSTMYKVLSDNIS